MSAYELLRTVYRRLRVVPWLGSLVEALRHRRFPVFHMAQRRYAEQQVILEAYGHALAGVRQALARHDEVLENQHQALARHDEALENQHQALARHDEALENQRQALTHLEAAVPSLIHENNLETDKKLKQLEERIEFQRQEILFELRYRDKDHTASPEVSLLPRFLNLSKLEKQKQQGGLRLNLGCGHKPDPERINVDLRILPGVDLVASVDQLPFAPGEVKEIYSSHLLEHFPLEQLKRSLLPRWIRLLAPGGEFRAIVPDAEAMLAAYARGEIDFSTLRLVTFGGQEYEGDFHYTMFTPESLATLLHEQGLTDVQVVAHARRNGLCYECEVVGKKSCP